MYFSPGQGDSGQTASYGRCRNAPERLPGSGYGTEDCGTASVEQTASGMGQAQRRIVGIHVHTQRRAAGESESFGRACHIGGVQGDRQERKSCAVLPDGGGRYPASFAA